MAAELDLSLFWDVLERNFPLAGPRVELAARLGTDALAALEAGGIFSYLRAADVVACPHPGGAGCPRQVIEHSNGTVQAVCGNDPAECDELDLTHEDIEILGVDPERLCHALRQPFFFGGRVEQIANLSNAYLAGTFRPEPAVRHSVYFVARCGEQEYAEVFDALRARHAGNTYAILVPTDRFVSTDVIRQMATLGVPIIPLQGTVKADASGRLTTSANVLRLFEGIGRRVAASPALANPVVAQALTHSGWQDLDENGYHRLLEVASEYEIVADERQHAVWKRSQRSHGIQPSYFRMFRVAVEKKRYFDPVTESPDKDQASGKQIFQRARQVIDIKYKAADGATTWRLFKTAKVDNHAEYQFQPDSDCKFALIFLPQS